MLVGALLGVMCRCIAGSKTMMDDENIMFSKIPFVWKEYSIADIKDKASSDKPFYHKARGYVIATGKGVLVLPVSTYKGAISSCMSLRRELAQRCRRSDRIRWFPFTVKVPGKMRRGLKIRSRISKEQIKLSDKIVSDDIKSTQYCADN